MLEQHNNYDWQEAFTFADKFSIDDVAEVLAESEGANDGDSWLSFGRLNSGSYYFLSAWCDYTGWDCQSGGDSFTHNDRDIVERMGMGDEERARLGIVIENTYVPAPIPDIED